jgi:hypothetical protein
MTCNRCRHFSTSEASAKNVPARIVFVCAHPDSGRSVIRIFRKFTECPENGHLARREILEMMGALNDDDPEKIAWAKNQENYSRLPEAWQRLKEQIDGIEVPRPKWCKLKGRGVAE